MDSMDLRKNVLARSRRIVVKVGSQLLAGAGVGLEERLVRHLALQMTGLVRQGLGVTLVSSGAIAMGLKALNQSRRPKDLGHLQAVAAVGQSGLMQRWREAFARGDVEVAQMLLTRGDFDNRGRYLNIRNCIGHLHDLGIVPVVNENDTVAVEEIRLGDNDILAAHLAGAIGADALILLTVVDGLQDTAGAVVDLVGDLTQARAMAGPERSAAGSGGMVTKLEAAGMVTSAGEVAVIANGRTPDILTRLMAGENLGTIFAPSDRKMAARQRWILQVVRPNGVINVDAGAATALTLKRKSLLATGITGAVGTFERGDVVVVRNDRGHEIARGVTNYSSQETRLIQGKRSTQFQKILERYAYDEVIHKDNLVLTGVEGGTSAAAPKPDSKP